MTPMTQPRFTEKTILRLLKGPALSVFLAFFLADRPRHVGEQWLAQRTGYSRKTARESLNYLADLDLVHQTAHFTGWRLTTTAYQLPLPLTELQPGDHSLGKIYPPTTTTTIDNLPEQTAAAAAEPMGKFYPLPDEISLDILTQAGIGRPTNEQLAALPWATEAYVTAHINHGRQHNDPLALVIHRIRAHDPPPECACGHCQTCQQRRLTAQVPAALQHIIKR